MAAIQAGNIGIRSKRILGGAYCRRKGDQKTCLKARKGERIIIYFDCKGKKLIDQKLSINKIIKLTKLEDLFEQMLKKRIYHKEEEVLEDTVQTHALVQTMGKG
ncbi:MAG: hypothetical protein ACFFDT_26420 [Candidatus Hodarchaeota archaeon]